MLERGAKARAGEKMFAWLSSLDVQVGWGGLCVCLCVCVRVRVRVLVLGRVCLCMCVCVCGCVCVCVLRINGGRESSSPCLVCLPARPYALTVCGTAPPPRLLIPQPPPQPPPSTPSGPGSAYDPGCAARPRHRQASHVL